MDGGLLAGIGLGIVFCISLAFILTPSEGGIPPTPAWQNIATNDTNSTTIPAWVNATSFNDNLWIISDGSILIEVIDYDGGAQ